ncbi:methyltransferase domain-containing protein [uncultured Sphaerotilus sp.]|uniref:methyltransferase domain-containing protein n=1 Tax=uncultured Sphaerotilus sp. TaxID=474984 RepID=UPI0030CA23DD
MSDHVPQRHLDLGCGTCPRNPYDRRHLCGTDIRPWDSATALPAADFDYRVANLVLDPIPWPDNSFESVSAFDFLEHVPRLMMKPDGSGTRFPFVELMDEVWRVLAPGGRLYAVTPAYPSPEAFQDPTHVNIITERTHEYFCGPQALGRMYGFRGHFRPVRVLRVNPGEHTTHRADAPATTPAPSLPRRLAHGLRDVVRRLRGRSPPPPGWLLWELEAVKPYNTP